MRADNCRRAGNYRGAGELHLEMGAGRDNHRGEGRSNWHYILQLWRIRGNRHGWSKRFVYLSN